MDSLLNDFPLCAPSHERELDEEDDTVSWLNFPIEEPFNDNYCSELLPVLGFAGKETDLVSMQKRSNSHHVDELPRPSAAASAQGMQQYSKSKVLSSVTEQNTHYIGGTSPLMQNQYPFRRPGKSEFNPSDASNANHIQSPVDSFMGSKLHKIDARQPSNRPTVNNFPYFSQLASLSGVHARNTATTSYDVSGDKEKVCDKNRRGTINSFNPIKPTFVSSSHQEVGSQGKLFMPPTDGCIESVSFKSDSLPSQQSEATCFKGGKNGKFVDHLFDSVPTEVMRGDKRIHQPVVAASSICSGNRLERGSSDAACSLKRKCHEREDSEDPSDEAEEESVGDRISGHTGSKRGRAADMHNLSERKRRERINKKMRALQELIPSCNKADKASMLDEAIEYMKTLQIQMQILSMGTGMYMPPMMLPSAMQQMHRTQMPQFLPMGIGMGMHDVNYSMTHMPNIQGPCYPVSGPPLTTTTTFPGAVGYSHHFLGHPGQEILMPTPHIPPPLFGIPPTRLPVGNVSAMTGTSNLTHLAPIDGSKETIQNVNSQKIPNDQQKSNK